MRLAGIQKKNLDARLRGHDGWISDTHFVELYLAHAHSVSNARYQHSTSRTQMKVPYAAEPRVYRKAHRAGQCRTLVH
jgi:hypothetical protein